jgi:hypothetical protein
MRCTRLCPLKSGVTLVKVIDALESCGMRDEGSTLGYEEVLGWHVLLEGGRVVGRAGFRSA